jgi:hypothetical protein
MLTIFYLATLNAWTICVLTLGVCFPELCRIDPEASLCLIWCRRRVANVVSYGIPMLLLAQLKSRVGVETLGVGLPALCLVASLGPCTLYMESCVGVGLPASCHVVSRGSSPLCIISFGAGKIGFTTFGVGFPASCLVALLFSSVL